MIESLDPNIILGVALGVFLTNVVSAYRRKRKGYVGPMWSQPPPDDEAPTDPGPRRRKGSRHV